MLPLSEPSKAAESNVAVCELSNRSRQRKHSVCLVCLDTNKVHQCAIECADNERTIARGALVKPVAIRRRAKHGKRLALYGLSKVKCI